MDEDRTVDPEIGAELSPELREILELTPHFYAIIQGPVPLGESEHLTVALDHIFGTREEAMQQIYEHIVTFCQAYSYPYNPEDWDLVALTPFNQN